MQESKDGTGRAYLSEPGIRPLSKHKGCYCVPWPSEALAELARILGETEPAHYYSGPMPDPYGWPMRAALAESLAAVTADGGPLDSLAGFNNDGMADHSRCFDCPTCGATPADPVILAAQRDLAVLSAYAAQVGA